VVDACVFLLVTNCLWVFIILVGLVWTLTLRSRFRDQMAQNTLEAQRVRKFVWAVPFVLTMPGVVMGFGLTIGGVPSVFSYVVPWGSGAWVWSFWCCVLLVVAVQTYWLYFGRGAEFLVAHRSLIPGWIPSTPRRLKIFYGLVLAWNIVFFAALWLLCFWATYCL